MEGSGEMFVYLSQELFVCPGDGLGKSTQETPRSNSPRTVLNARVPFVVCGGGGKGWLFKSQLISTPVNIYNVHQQSYALWLEEGILDLTFSN